ncbi:MAG: hypothetical protein IBX69_14765 [Anaerolineales bacterium]|nr:hypothetical protein [Anaerolineales bacterium]
MNPFRNKFEKKSAKERFELLLESLIIPLSIPEGLTTLAKEAKSKNINGIGLITNMRNSLIHPRSKLKSSSHTSLLLLEARNLALWYVEMIILRLCNYDGFYSNRVLGRMRWAGEVELVPWELK